MDEYAILFIFLNTMEEVCTSTIPNFAVLTDSAECLEFDTVFIAHLPHRLYSAVDCLEVSCQLLFSMPCHWQQLYIVYSLVVELYVH